MVYKVFSVQFFWCTRFQGLQFSLQFSRFQGFSFFFFAPHLLADLHLQMLLLPLVAASYGVRGGEHGEAASDKGLLLHRLVRAKGRGRIAGLG